MNKKDEALRMAVDIEKLLSDAKLPLPRPHGSEYFEEYKNRYVKFAEAYHHAKAALSDETVALPDGWVSVEDKLPELKDDSVLGYFENGSIETIHIEDYFKPITNGYDNNGNQIYPKWYLHHDPKVTHWMPLQAAPTLNEKG